jgi:uncharacterized protein
LTRPLVTTFTVIVTLWFAIHAYIAFRLLRPVRGWKRLALAALVLLMAALPPVTRYLDRSGASFPMKDVVRWVGFAGIGFSSLLGSWMLVEDLVRLGTWITSRIRRRPRTGPGFEADRRRFLRSSLNLGVLTAAGGITAVEADSARDIPDVREVRVPVRGLHPDLDGFRIAQITDLHVGPTIRRDYVAGVVRATNALSADVIAVTGDVVDGQFAEFKNDVAPLRELAAPKGVFFVTGNHEYYWDTPGWLGEFRGFGWHVLLNEHRVLERGNGKILLAGVTDFRSARYVPEHVSDPEAARAGAPATDVSILLAHQPRSIFAAAKARYDLQISGHTHGGQFFPANLLVYLLEPYLSGLHRHDDTWIYVSCGTGYWGPPLRLGVPKEITLLMLVREE